MSDYLLVAVLLLQLVLVVQVMIQVMIQVVQVLHNLKQVFSKMVLLLELHILEW